MEINYMVYVPAHMDVVLNNKFGDIYMDDLDGQVDIELSNGVLKANRLEGNCLHLPELCQWNDQIAGIGQPWSSPTPTWC